MPNSNDATNDNPPASQVVELPRLQHIESQDPRLPQFRQRSLNMFYIAAGLSLMSVFVVGILGLIFAVIAVGYVLLTVQFNIYHRTQIENFHHYRQIEALLSLHNMIRFGHPLPPMRLWAISPDFATLIVSTICQHKPRHIVELGSGTSTLIAAYCLEELEQGSITSFDHDAAFASVTRHTLQKHNQTERATVIHAPLMVMTLAEDTALWYDIAKLQPLEAIDLLIVDGPPEDTEKLARYPALPLLYGKLTDGAIILVDDYMRADEHTMVNRWLAEFDLEVVETLANEKGAAILRKKKGAPASDAPIC